jgi:hypothetical protein
MDHHAKLKLLKKATEKLNIGHIAIAPIVATARAIHQIPIVADNLLRSRDTTRPTIRTKSICRPMDTAFNDDNWINYQCIGWWFTETYFKELMPEIPGRIKRWSAEHFQSPDTCMFVTIDTAHPVYTDDPTNQFAKIVEWLNTNPPSVFLGSHTHATVSVPDHNMFVGFLDHYSCDGSILFDYFLHVLDIHHTQPPPPLPKYQYIPLLTDAITAECAIRTSLNVWSRPVQITTHGTGLVGSRNILHKADAYEWSRWGNYAESVLRVFEKLEGVRGDLGTVLFGSTASPPITHPVPPHLNICLCAGIDTDCMFGNNRIGCILVQVTRPDPMKSRNERMDDLMEQFKTQCTENFTDAISSYDALRGFDVGKIREYFSANVFDIVFTSFRCTECPDGMTSGFGGFTGTYDSPMMYINSMTTKDQSHISYTTNWW